jgi:hypothetical protein
MVHLALELDVRRRILRRPGADELGRALRRCDEQIVSVLGL